ncbi:MAG: preprotein translocase subunit SecG [Pirellulaceae bacterium]|nr:preprotein translocase subunit SecG [Pirellulaceae bacterium]
MEWLLWFGMFFGSIFLIMLILIQRGRGGGLAGALGGAGGESALGTKAGDLFTRITVVVAAVWILVCLLTIKIVNESASPGSAPSGNNTISSPSTDSGTGTDQTPLTSGETSGTTGNNDTGGNNQ